MRLTAILATSLGLVSIIVAQAKFLNLPIDVGETESIDPKHDLEGFIDNLDKGLFEPGSKHHNIPKPRQWFNAEQALLEPVEVGWIQDYSFSSSRSEDFVSDVTLDTYGNTYVTGYSQGANSEYDYVTIKYDPDGTESWVARYNGSLDLSDKAVALVVDSASNVYVTGNSTDENEENDIVTIKYSSSGAELWVNQYSGTTTGDDKVKAMTSDDSGNIYITGETSSLQGDYDFITIKYDPEGNVLWTRNYSGTEGGSDIATSIAMGADSSVFVVGRSIHPEGVCGFATINYTLEGQENWVSRYPPPPELLSFSFAPHVTIAPQGDIIVSGTTFQSDTTYAFTTIKYTEEGEQEWVVSYDTPWDHFDGSWMVSNRLVAVDTDDSGNVFVGGKSKGIDGDYDYLTIRYNPDGSEAWIKRYDGQGNLDDELDDLEVDPSGNVVVTGTSVGSGGYPAFCTIKYDSEGEQIWAVSSEQEGPHYSDRVSLAIDASEAIYVSGASQDLLNNYDILMIKYTGSGLESWQSSYDGPGFSSGYAHDMALGDDGSIYVAGVGNNGGDSNRISVVRYFQDGSSDLFYEKNIPFGGWVAEITFGPDGSIYLAGAERTADYRRNFLTIKIQPNGEEQWSVNYGGDPNFYNDPSDIAVDSVGNVYVAGWSFITEDFDYSIYTTIKYNPDGSEAWVASYTGMENTESIMGGIVIDGFGNVYVTGQNYNTDGYRCALTIKYNPDGSEAWVASYQHPDNGYSGATAISLDATGNIHVVGGRSIPGELPYEYLVLAYDPEGILLWENSYGGTENNGYAFNVDIDEEGNTYVSGVSDGEGSSLDYATIKYRPNGQTAWVRRYSGEGHQYDQIQAQTLDEFGNVYVTGNSVGENGYDFVTIKYTSEGDQAWMMRYDGYSGGRDLVQEIEVDTDGNVFIMGNSTLGSVSIAKTIKYIQPEYSSLGCPPPSPIQYRLDQNFPNPFNPITTLYYQIPEISEVSLKIYDITGREVHALVSRSHVPGRYQVDWDGKDLEGHHVGAGIYLARFQAHDYSSVVKMVYLR